MLAFAVATESLDKQSVNVYLWSRLIDLASASVRYAMYCVVAYFTFRSITVLAGKQTDASFIVKLLMSKDNDYGIPWIVAVVSVVWGVGQTVLRRRKTQYFQSRITELEKRLDPNRSSSGLTVTGVTNPRDKI